MANWCSSVNSKTEPMRQQTAPAVYSYMKYNILDTYITAELIKAENEQYA